jgi:hypothetical protein
MNYSSIFKQIKKSCLRGEAGDIDVVLSLLNDKVDLPTTKAIDLYLGQVTAPQGIKRVEYYLFNGTPIQRNYCTLFFARRGDWSIVNEAYDRGLVDGEQAYSR